MVGPLDTWPAWPEFTSIPNDEQSDDLASYKSAIIQEYGQEALTKSWLKVCSELKKVTKEIREKGSAVIPEISYSDLQSLSQEQKEEYKKVGCFLIRGVVDKDVAEEWFKDLKSYVAENKDLVTGMLSCNVARESSRVTVYRMAGRNTCDSAHVLQPHSNGSALTSKLTESCPRTHRLVE